MTWICPYCGTENYQDDRVGRQEPRCRQCSEDRISPEDLERRKETEAARLEKEIEQANEHAAGIKDSIEFHQSIIAEHTGPLADLKQELEELRDEIRPVRESLKKWENQIIFYEEKDRALKAEQDKYQTTLPFEVAA